MGWRSSPREVLEAEGPTGMDLREQRRFGESGETSLASWSMASALSSATSERGLLGEREARRLRLREEDSSSEDSSLEGEDSERVAGGMMMLRVGPSTLRWGRWWRF